jgi:phospholipase/carboxylesterase
VVPYSAAELSLQCLRAEGFQVDFNSYAMEHSLCPEQLGSLRDWLVQRLA